MSRKIVIKFSCVACTNQTPAQVTKPTIMGTTVSWQECENCDTRHLLKVNRLLNGDPTAFQYSVLDAVVTAKGVRAHEALQAKASPTLEGPDGVVRDKVSGEVVKI